MEKHISAHNCDTPFSPPFRFLFVCYCKPTNTNSRLSPAPLSLCSISTFDMKRHAKLCPTERNALNEIYNSAKGGEWTDSEHWTAEFISYCDWKGVGCDASGKVEALNLTNNGLSGSLSASVGDLHGLKVLDLTDNDIKVNNQLHSYNRFASILHFHTI